MYGRNRTYNVVTYNHYISILHTVRKAYVVTYVVTYDDYISIYYIRKAYVVTYVVTYLHISLLSIKPMLLSIT